MKTLAPNLLLEYRYYRYVAAVALAWSLLVAASYALNVKTINKHTLEIAEIEAKSYLNKDRAFRLWGTSHGGVYVPPTKRTPPNPHLAHIPDRDVLTTSGKSLTLMNPAYMLRQIMEDYAELYGVRGHITSLDPLRPENAPDEWESKALQGFKGVEDSYSEIVSLEGKPYFRFMQPLFTIEGCLKCHAIQGYKAGDVRGGVSIAVPLKDLLTLKQKDLRAAALTHLLFWTVGALGLGYSSMSIRRNILRRQRAEGGILSSLKEKEILLKEVHHRVKNNLAIVSSLLQLQSRHITDPEVASVLRDSQSRIRAMALVHKKLYLSQDLARVDLEEYVRQLVYDLASAHNRKLDAMRLEFEVSQAHIPIDMLIPLGLIITELVTNSLKHAYAELEGRPGLYLAIGPVGESGIRLQVADNGPGLPEGFDPGSAESLGLQIVTGLVSQLGGTMVAARGSADFGGASFEITFKTEVPPA